MEEPTVAGMIYKEVMILRKQQNHMQDDITEIKKAQAVRDAKVVGAGMVVTVVLTVIFQLILAVIQRG